MKNNNNSVNQKYFDQKVQDIFEPIAKELHLTMTEGVYKKFWKYWDNLDKQLVYFELFNYNFNYPINYYPLFVETNFFLEENKNPISAIENNCNKNCIYRYKKNSIKLKI